MSSAFTLSQSWIRVSLALPPSLPEPSALRLTLTVVDRCDSVTSCAEQINLNRPIGMYLDEVEDVRKRELCEFEYRTGVQPFYTRGPLPVGVRDPSPLREAY
jgi:hypothetical protein